MLNNMDRVEEITASILDAIYPVILKAVFDTLNSEMQEAEIDIAVQNARRRIREKQRKNKQSIRKRKKKIQDNKDSEMRTESAKRIQDMHRRESERVKNNYFLAIQTTK